MRYKAKKGEHPERFARAEYSEDAAFGSITIDHTMDIKYR